MPLHLGPRWHAFVHGLFRNSDEAETRELYGRVRNLFARHELIEDDAREELIFALTHEVLTAFDLDADHHQSGQVVTMVGRLLDYEGMFLLPEIDWTVRQSVTQWWEIRDELNRQKKFVEEFPAKREQLVQTFVNCLICMRLDLI